MEKLILSVSCIAVIGFASGYAFEERAENSLCDICGIPATSAKIYNGKAVAEGEIPWRVYFRVGWKAECGGSIINKNWVLTAGHCVDKIIKGEEANDKITVRAGSTDKANGGQVFQINGLQVTKHENYGKENGIPWNDTALIKVPDPGFDFSNPNIKPVCLPYKFKDVQVEGNALASGWGRTNNTYGSAPQLMLKANVQIGESEKCNQLFNKHPFLKGYKISSKEMCISTPEATPCEGDSGGSIDYKDDRGRNYAVGINSYMLADCGSPDNVLVLVRTAMYLDWIEKNTGETFCKE